MSSKHKSRESRRRAGRSRRRVRALYLAALAAAGIALVAVLALGQRDGGATAEQAAAATGTLTAPRPFHDFGRISMKDGPVSIRFPVRNAGDAPALVEQISTSCMCTEASLLVGAERIGPFGMQGHGFIPRIDRVIQPGEDAVVEAVFDPNAHGPAGIGRNDRSVNVMLGGRRMLQLQFTAYVTP